MERIQTKALVEGAIFAGVTALLGILYYYMQYLGIIAMVWPVPVIIVGYRNGLKASILSALSAGLIVSLLTQPLVGVGLLAGFGLPGVLMGYMINKRISPYVIVVLCGLVLSLTTVGEFLISFKAMGIDAVSFFANIDSTFKQQMETALNIYRQMGISEADILKITDYFSQTLEMMKLIFPSALVISGLIFSIIDYKLTGLILKRIGSAIPDIEEFSKWRLREPYTFILFGLVIFSVAVSYFKLTWLTAAALNISTLVMLVFSVLGISVISFFSGVLGVRHGIPKGLRIIIVIFIVLFFIQVVPFVGILDMAMDFRKLKSTYPGGVR